VKTKLHKFVRTKRTIELQPTLHVNAYSWSVNALFK